MFPKVTVLFVLTVLTAVGRAEPEAALVPDQDLQAAGLSRYWQAHLPLAPGDSVDTAMRVDEVLYAISDLGLLYAVTADTGLIRWARKVAEPDHQIYRPSHVRTSTGTGPVILATTRKVLVIDRYSGELLQSFEPPFAAGAGAVADGGIVYMGSAGGRFYSLQLAYPEPYKRWEVLADGPVTTTPVLYDRNMLLFVGQNGTVFTCRASDKTFKWRSRPGGPIMTEVAVDEDGVYLASLDRSLYKVNLDTGRLAWRVRLPRPLLEGPLAIAHTVFQYCTDHGLSAIDADTGTERWRRPDGRTLAAHTRGGDLLLTEDRRLNLVDHETGDLLQEVDAPAVTAAVSNTLDDAAYVYAADGRVLCVRLDSVPYLRRQQVLSAREQLTQPPTAETTAASAEAGPASSRTDRRDQDPLRSRRDTGRD
jgi:outer membrane protein assembly factor BamB